MCIKKLVYIADVGLNVHKYNALPASSRTCHAFDVKKGPEDEAILSANMPICFQPHLNTNYQSVVLPIPSTSKKETAVIEKILIAKTLKGKTLKAHPKKHMTNCLTNLQNNIVVRHLYPINDTNITGSE